MFTYNVTSEGVTSPMNRKVCLVCDKYYIRTRQGTGGFVNIEFLILTVMALSH